MDNRKISLKRAGAGIIVVLALLLSSTFSWGDTAIYVYQTAGNGALTIKTITDTGITATPVQTIPNSCYRPDLFWDSAAGALRLNGFNAYNDPAWTGTINATGVLANIMPSSLPTVFCSLATTSIVSAAFPDNIPCTSYGAWIACTGGVMTRTGNPQGCTAAQLTTLPCTCLLYTSPSPRDRTRSRMPSSA